MGILLLVLPLMPFLSAGGRQRDAGYRPGLLLVPAGELRRRSFLAIFFAGYLVRTRESLTSTGTRFLGMTWPRARELGPLLVIWLVSLGIIVMQRRPRHRL